MWQQETEKAEPSQVGESHLTGSGQLGPTANPISERDRTNYLQTLMHMLNGFIGSGILSMPMAFRDGGVVMASVATPLVGLLSAHCIHMLLAVNRLAMRINHSTPFDYHEVAEFAFLVGPKRLRRFAKTSRLVALSVLVATQLGGCCVYLLFISANLHQFLARVMGEETGPSRQVCLLACLPVMLLLNSVRNMRHLSFLSALSNLLQVAGISVIFSHLFSSPVPSVARLPAVGSRVAQCAVTTLFIFEGTSVSMSLYKTIDQPSHFSRPLGVLNVGLTIITGFYLSLGFFGYVRFGQSVAPSITESLPPEPVYLAAQVMYAAAVALTYPVILYVPVQVLWPAIERRLGGVTRRWLLVTLELTFRASLVLLTFALAALIPHLEVGISLAGAIMSSSIAVIIPVLLHSVAFWNQPRTLPGRVLFLTKNLATLAIGVFALVFGSYYSLRDMVQ